MYWTFLSKNMLLRIQYTLFWVGGFTISEMNPDITLRIQWILCIMYLLDPNKKIKEQKHPGEITDTIVDDFYVYSLM